MRFFGLHGKNSHKPKMALGKYLVNVIFGHFISLLRFGLCIFWAILFHYCDIWAILAYNSPKNTLAKYKNCSNEIISSKTQKQNICGKF